MQIHKVIQKRLRGALGGVQGNADVNATIAANVGEQGQTTHVSSTQTASASASDERAENVDRAG